MELIAQAHLQTALVLFEHGTPATDAVLSRSLDRLAEISSALQDPGLAALPLALMAMGKVFRGPIREGVEALEEAIPLMQKHRDFIGAAFARGWLAIGYAGLGEFEKAEAASREATEMATNGDVIAQIDAQISQAMVRSMHGDLDEAAPLAQACVSLSQDSGATYCAVVSAWILGDVYQRQGRFNEADEALRLGLEIAPGADPGMWGPTLQAWLRANAEALGDHLAADEGWEASLTAARAIGNNLGVAAVHWKRAEVAVRQERWDAALEDMAASAAILEEQGARPNLARVLRGWGETLRSAGRFTDGDEQLRRSLLLFEEMGLEREASEVRDELGITARPEA
jgi:tetratricopeptide (TPR) repeat protein